MQVRQEGIVAVLQGAVGLRQHVLVPQRRQDGGDRRFADVATQPLAVLVAQRLEALQLADPGQVIELLAAVGEVLAQPLVRLDPEILQGLLHHLLEQVAAAAAASARFGAALHRRQLVIARLDRGHHGPLLTLWQEQRMALSGSTRGAAAPPASPPAGRAAAGAVPPRSGSTAAAAHNRRRPHQDGAEQPAPSPSVTSFL